MIRDFDLIRKILLSVQSEPAGSQAIVVKFPDQYNQVVVNEHIDLLIQSG